MSGAPNGTNGPTGTRLAIDVQGVVKHYGERKVLEHLNMRVPEGVVFGLLGPNGAGKSTTVKILCGTLQPDEGECRVAGLSCSRDRKALKLAIGYMPQQFGLYDYLSVRENLSFYADLYLAGAAAAKTRVAEVIELCGLQNFVKHRASSLSGGWRQRLALGCAILHRPRVLFLDEPTAGVDPVWRRRFWELIHQLNESGVTLMVTTHYMEELERCHIVGLLRAGRIGTFGPPRTLKASVGEDRELLSVVTPNPEAVLAELRELPGLIDAYLWGEEIRLSFSAGDSALGRLHSHLAKAGRPGAQVERRPATMEDVFIASARALPSRAQ